LTEALLADDNRFRPYTEVFMPERFPSNVFIAKAMPDGRGSFVAVFSAPGMVPQTLTKRDGSPSVFETEELAEYHAGRAMISALNGPRIKAGANKRAPERYQKMTGPEFAMALSAAGITPTFFAYLYGTSQDRVLKWIDGVEDVPHPVRIVLALFAKSVENVDLAQEVTEAVTTSRRPERSAD